MDINKIPVVNHINRSMNIMTLNLVILAVVFLALGIIIIFFPDVLVALASALLIITALTLLNLAYRIHATKKKYIDWMK